MPIIPINDTHILIVMLTRG